MVRILSDFVLQFKLNRKLKSLTSISKKHLIQFKTVVVLIPESYEIDEQLFLSLSKAFKISNQNITIVVFSQRKIEEQKVKIKNRINCSRDAIGFWGNINGELSLLFQQEFDLLINYFDDKPLLPSFISAHCQAKVRLGFSKSNHALNDLMLAINPQETKLFLSESTRYLKTILKKVK
jgi:hypothetical protein